ncbi:AAA family ATPase [Terrilactibacillus sp. S3-3]|nr:AAA family ATPase [Terrilactibacillus sp. S3-3]
MTSLRINQFGRFDNNQKISFPDKGFIIVYGENEAGKSTLMKFITYLLFGFPAKSECTPFLRNGDEGRFGGALTFTADDGRMCTLMRTFKENDHPRLYARTNDGTTIEIGAETFFKGMDRLLYNAVFFLL